MSFSKPSKTEIIFIPKKQHRTSWHMRLAPFLLPSPVAFVILPYCFKLWSENYTQMYGSFPGHSNFEEHRSSPGTKSFFPGLLFPGALALSLRPVGMVAPAPASHAGYAPGEEWSSLERLRCHNRLKQSLRLSLPWQRGGYYLQSPLLSGPGAS